jgi:hypothetical protein
MGGGISARNCSVSDALPLRPGQSHPPKAPHAWPDITRRSRPRLRLFHLGASGCALGGGRLGILVLNDARSEEKSVDEPNDNDGDQNEYPIGN